MTTESTEIVATVRYLSAVAASFRERFPSIALDFYKGYVRDFSEFSTGTGNTKIPSNGAVAELGIDYLTPFSSGDQDPNPFVDAGPGFTKMKLQATILLYQDASQPEEGLAFKDLPAIRAIAIAERIMAWCDNQVFMEDEVSRPGEGDEITKTLGIEQLSLVDPDGRPETATIAWRVMWRTDFTVMNTIDQEETAFGASDTTGIDHIVFAWDSDRLEDVPDDFADVGEEFGRRSF